MPGGEVLKGASQALATKIGGEALGDLPARLGARAAKLAAVGAAEYGRREGLEDAFERFDITKSLGGDRQGITANIIAPHKFDAAPELYWGPSMQLGTYLGIEDEALRLAVDVIIDPLNLILPGSNFLLNNLGKVAKLITAATAKGAKGATTAEAMVGVERTLEFIGAIMGNPAYKQEVRAAVSGGMIGNPFNKLIQKGLDLAKTNKISDDAAQILTSMRKNRRGFSDLIDLDKKLGGGALPERYFLEPTIFGRIGKGQVNPLIRFDKPFAMTRQLLGIGYKNHEFLTPLSRGLAGGFAKGLDAFRGRAIMEFGDLAPELSLKSAIGAKKFLGPGSNNLGDITEQLGFYRVLNEEASDQIVTMLGLQDEITDEGLAAAFKFKHRVSWENATKKQQGDFRELVLQHHLGTREGSMEVLEASRQLRFEEFLDESHMRGAAAGLPTLSIEEKLNSLRYAYVSLRFRFDDSSVGILQANAEGFAHAIAARTNFGTVMASNVHFGLRELIDNTIKGKGARGVREGVRELIGRMIDTPESFVTRTVGGETRIFYDPKISFKKGEKGRGDLLLDLVANRRKDIGEIASTVGFPIEIKHIADVLDQTQRALGNTLFEHEGVIGNFLEDYVQRAFRFDRKIFGGKKQKDSREWIREQLELGDAGEFAEVVKLTRQREGQVGFSQVRRATETAMVKMEKELKLGTFDKDALNLFTDYLDSANRAVSLNILSRDLTKISPLATADMFERAGVRGLTAGEIGKHGGLQVLTPERFRKLPRKMQEAYTKFEQSKRFGWGTPVQRAELTAAEATLSTGAIGKQFARHDRTAIRREIAQDLAEGTDANAKALRVSVLGSEEVPTAEMLKAIETNRFGKKFTQASAVRKRLKREVNKRVGSQRGKLVKATTRLREKIAGSKVKNEFYVHKDIEGIMKETFRTFGENRALTGPVLRRVDEINRRLKSVLLLGDVFHLNVLTFTQMLMDPAAQARAIVGAQARTPEMLARTARTAGIGAAGGAAVGAGFSGEGDDILTTTLVGALYGTSLRAVRQNALSARRHLLNPAHMDTLAAMAHGGFTGRPNDRSIGVVGRWMSNYSNRLRREGGTSLLISPLDGTRHVLEAFEQNMWEVVQIGSKQHYFDTVYWKKIGDLEKAGVFTGMTDGQRLSRESEVAREVMQTANVFLGGQRFSLLLNDPGWQQNMRLFMLAPDWTIGNLTGAGAVFMNMNLASSGLLGAGLGGFAELAEAGFDPSKMSGMGVAGGAGMGLAMSKWMKFVRRRMSLTAKRLPNGKMGGGDILAKEARRIYAAALGGGYFFANMLNYAYTGHFMWDNPEGKHLSIAMPGRDDRGRQTFTSLGKPWKEAFEFASIIESDKYPVPVFGRLASKMAVLPRWGMQVLMNDSGFGPIVQQDDGPFEVGTALLMHTFKAGLPIISQTPTRSAKEFLAGSGAGPSLARFLERGAGFPTSTLRGAGRFSLDELSRVIPPGL
jgi:hypothetical protein